MQENQYMTFILSSKSKEFLPVLINLLNFDLLRNTILILISLNNLFIFSEMFSLYGIDITDLFICSSSLLMSVSF